MFHAFLKTCLPITSHHSPLFNLYNSYGTHSIDLFFYIDLFLYCSLGLCNLCAFSSHLHSVFNSLLFPFELSAQFTKHMNISSDYKLTEQNQTKAFPLPFPST